MPIYGTPPDGGQLPWVETFDAADTGAWAINTLTQNAISLRRVRVGRPITVSKVRVRVGTAAGNSDFGIYTSNDGGSTLNRVASTGSVAVAGAGTVWEVPLTASFTFQPGVDYWIGGGTDSATAAFGRFSTIDAATAGDGLRLLVKSSGWSSGLPASLSSLSGGGQTIWMRFVP